ncbi:MAG TPA: hypothetical protein VD965_11980 [Burkholderiales bacterium]|nr:hypothetical protein [Burkholderiales bacterium]
MERLIAIALALALAVPACASTVGEKPATEVADLEKEKVDREKELAAKRRSDQAKAQESAAAGATRPPAGGTDLGTEAEKEEARIRLNSGRADRPRE